MNVKTVQGSELLVVFSYKNTAIPREDIEWFEQVLLSQLRSGRHFQHGGTLQVGWSLLQFRECSPGKLELQEPDFQSFPIKWVSGVDHCLLHLGRQKDVTESVLPAVEPVFPSIRQAALLCDHISEKSDIVMERQAPADAFSGWSVTCSGSGHSKSTLHLDSLFSMAMRLPSIIPFLALPPGFSVSFTSTGFSIMNEGAEVAVRENSFLASCRN